MSTTGSTTSTGRGKRMGRRGVTMSAGRLARTGVVGVVAGSLLVTLLVAPPAVAEDDLATREAWSDEDRRKHSADLWPEIEPEEVTASKELGTRPALQPEKRVETEPVEIQWPEADHATVNLDPHDPSDEVVADTVTISPADHAGAEDTRGAARASESADGDLSVDVEVFDRDIAIAAGIEGLLLSVEPVADSQSASRRSDDTVDALDEPAGVVETGDVEVTVDYSAFAGAYGGNWASRLRLIALPDCDSDDPATCDPAETVELRSVNDTTAQTITASLNAETYGVLALAASESGSTGDWSATPLSASSSWQVSQQTGSFSWSYPVNVVPVAGDLQPSPSLGYASSTLDGRIAVSNNQSSWVGDGWDLSSGHIERKYVSCAGDQEGSANNKTRTTGDLCWKTDNATLVLNDLASELVKDEATGAWRAKADDGTKIEHLTGGWNSGQDGEYWKVTTTDGTQYWFGREKRSASDSLALNSAWTVPVFGNHPGEPCYNSSFAASSCTQVWRWNLDYVVDVHGNSMTYVYAKETNRYGRNLNEQNSGLLHDSVTVG